jgi:septal ring factor EnvC (AmiA/AmiB activator)
MMESEKEAKEAIELIHGLPPLLKTSLGNAFFESNVLQKVDDMRSWCDVYLNDLRATLHKLLQQEEQKRQEVLAAQVNGKSEELELTQQMLSELLCQEDEVRLAIRSVIEDLDALSEQERSVKAQMAALTTEETRLKNELSLFSTITNIIPDLSEKQKFVGHLLVKDDISKISLDPAEMSPFQISKAVWDML